MKRLVFIIISIFAFVNCSTEETKNYITYNLIGEGNLNGEENIDQQFLVIKSDQEWNNLLAKINSVNNVSDKFSETEIDFSNHIIIAIFDKIRMTGDYQIEISNIIDGDKSIVVKIQTSTPKGIAPHVITQPFFIAKINKTQKTIIFE